MKAATAFTPPRDARVLRLTLSKKPFEAMVTGEKTREYRRPSDWIKSRIEGREPCREATYDYVLFTNGYGADKPWLATLFEGVTVCRSPQLLVFSNGLQVEVNQGDYIIHLGAIAATGNLKPPTPPTIKETTPAQNS